MPIVRLAFNITTFKNRRIRLEDFVVEIGKNSESDGRSVF